MTAWCHLPTILKQRLALHIAGLIALCVALTTTLIFAHATHAAPGINKTLNFQARLQTATGAVVPDGHYNIQFKLYQDGSGTTAGNPGGTLKWTENYVNNGGTSGVQIKNGYMSVNLGSNNPFGSSVDWDQDTLWLSMNIAGSAAGCTTFGSSPCTSDGEMLPMKRLTSTPYAMNAGAVGGKTANQLVQLGQGTQTDSGTGTSVAINKTSTGDFLQLQNSGVDAFTVDNAGNIVFGGSTSHSIAVGNAGTDTDGSELTIAAGGGGSGSGSDGGNLVLAGGAAGGTDGDGGDISIDAGAGTGSGSGGTIAIGATNAANIYIGSNSSGAAQTIVIGNESNGGTQNVTVGAGAGAGGGTTNLQAKDTLTISTNGTTRATFGNENSVTFGNGIDAIAPNDFTIQGTNSTSDLHNGGSLTISGGNATDGDTNGGNVTLIGGSGSGNGASGLVVLGTPAFSTTQNDANCYTGGSTVAASCTIATSSVNGSAAIIVGFSTTGQVATLPDPTITTAGRAIYIMGANGSEDFALAINGASSHISMRANTAVSMLWNGSDWIVAGTSGSVALNDIYDSGTNAAGVHVGNPDDSTATLFTVDKASSAPSITDDALLGSMYYDTTLGKLQCYEADGWGACGEAPDTFVSLSPEFSGAVTNGSGLGQMTTDLCSDSLDINDATNGPEICSADETYNFYNWNSEENTNQTKSIYVSYKLPASFKEFVAGSTSLLGRRDSTNANVNYQVYRNDGSGLTACGSAVSVTSTQNAWQTGTAAGDADPSDCGDNHFEAGDTIVIRINMSAHDDANAYVSNLGFIFSNN